MKTKLSSLLFCLFLAGCIGGVSMPSKFYSLESLSPETAAETYSLKTAVGVEEFRIPRYIDRPQIVTRDANAVELKVSELNRWSEPLSFMMQRTMADDLSVYLPNSMVKPKIYARESFNYNVFVEVNRFDATLGKTAILEAWWSIFNAKDNSLVTRQKSTFSLPIGDNYDDMVIAQSKLLQDLAKQIAQTLNKRKK